MHAESTQLQQHEVLPTVVHNDHILNIFLQYLKSYLPNIETPWATLNKFLPEPPNNRTFAVEIENFISRVNMDAKYTRKLIHLSPEGLVLSLGHHLYLPQHLSGKVMSPNGKLFSLMEEFLQTMSRDNPSNSKQNFKAMVENNLKHPIERQVSLNQQLVQVIMRATPDTPIETLENLIRDGADPDQIILCQLSYDSPSVQKFAPPHGRCKLSLLTISCMHNPQFPRVLLAYGADPNLYDTQFPISPLQLLMEGYCLNNLFKTLDAYWSKFEQQAVKTYPTDNTAKNNYIKQLILMFAKAGANLNFVNESDENSVLHWLCQQDEFDLSACMLVLKNYESLRTVVNKELNTPLHLMLLHASQLSLTDLQFMAQGVDFNQANAYGRTPLHLFFSSKLAGNIEALNFLLNQEANLSLLDTYQNHALHFFCANPYSFNLEMLKFLCAQGADLQQRNSRQQTSVHKLCGNNQLDFDTLNFMLEQEVDFSARDIDRNTPLNYLCYHANLLNQEQFLSVVSLIIQQWGKEILAPNHDGNTPLHLLCYSTRFNLDAAILLLSYGLDPYQKNQNKQDVFTLLCVCLSLTIQEKLTYISILEKVRAAYLAAPLFFTIEHNNAAHLQELLNQGENPNTEYQGQSILLAALLQEKPELALMILEHKLNDSYSFTALDQQQELFGTTALHIALSFGYYDLALLLLARGANPCLSNNQGKTALMIAVNKGLISIEFATNWQEQFALIAASGDLNAKNEWLEVLSVELAHGIATAAALTTVTPFLELTDQCLSPQDPYAYDGDSKTL